MPTPPVACRSLAVSYFTVPFGERPWMSRTLTLLFRRDPSKDRQSEAVDFEGYQILWPDGKPVAVGLDAFCKHGQRLLGLGKHLANCREKMIKMICFHLDGREDDLNRIPGHRVRRFYIERTGDAAFRAYPPAGYAIFQYNACWSNRIALVK